MKGMRYSNFMAFDEWRAGRGFSFFGKQLWPQVTYDVNTGKPFLLVFENNADRMNMIDWPVTAAHLPGMTWPLLNLDFNQNVPMLDNGQPWDYQKFGRDLTHYLGRYVYTSPITTPPTSFWDYRLATRPSQNLTCDIDSLEVTQSGAFFGVEATRFNETISSHQDAVDYLHNSIFRGRPRGFNILQFKAQIWTLVELGGSLYMVVHHTTQNKELDEDADALFLELNKPVFTAVSDIVASGSVNAAQVATLMNNSSWGPFIDQYRFLMSQ